MTKNICIIPARGGSKGIPKKNLVDIAGRPLIEWSIKQALETKNIHSVYVTSDSDEILELSKNVGAIPIKRPSELSGDKTTSESALIHAVNEIKKTLNDIGFIVFLQATSPLRESSDIEGAINKTITEDCDSLFSACALDDFLIWNIENGKPESINYDFSDRKRRQDFSCQYVENGSIYVFKPGILINTNNRLGGKIGMFIMDKWKMFEIDDYEGLELCEYFMSKKLLNKNNL